MIEIAGTAAIRRNFVAPHICMVKVSLVLVFDRLLCARQSHGDSALELCLDVRRVTFIDGGWLSSLSPEDAERSDYMKIGENHDLVSN